MVESAQCRPAHERLLVFLEPEVDGFLNQSPIGVIGLTLFELTQFTIQ
jgi:hypothetical protein